MHIRLFILYSSTFFLLFLPASQSNSSLKKQRSRGIFSTFFCCFRNYNVDSPATNTNASSPPPPVEENGSPPKVSCSTTKLLLVVLLRTLEISVCKSFPSVVNCLFVSSSIFSLSYLCQCVIVFWGGFSFVLLPTPHPVFVCVVV